MKFYGPTSILKFLCLIILSTLNYSCVKDSDILENEALGTAPNSDFGIETQLENIYFSKDNLPQMGFETRTAEFHPINKDKEGQNTEEDQGYENLVFDLSEIDSIGGTLDFVKLQFATGDSNGKDAISVFKSTLSDWTKESVLINTKPEEITLLGELEGEFELEQNQEIVLNKSEILPEKLNLVIPHNKSGNLVIASKEDGSKSDPVLLVTYYVRHQAKSLAQDIDVEGDVEAAASSSYKKDDKNKGTLTAVYATTSTGNKYPDARPSANVVSGNAPLKVQFGSSKSSDDKGIVLYQWYFMDGTTATGPTPSHTFTKPGTYNVILAIEDKEGLRNARIIIITVKESVNKVPDARPSANVVSGNAPLKVQFGSSKSSDDKGIVSYQWYFMDGTTATGPAPSHTFTSPGIYKVILAIEDKEGLRNARIIIITVKGIANKAPDARPSANVVSGNAPLKVQFGSSKSSDDKGIVSYTWDFKDGSTATGASPLHTFTNPGTYKVVLKVKDKEGLTNARIIIITVTGTSLSGGSTSGVGGSVPSISIPSDAVKASSFGYRSGDATAALKAAINSSNSTIVVDRQSGDWIVGPLNFVGLRNKTIIFEEGVVLRSKSGAYRSTDRLFQLVNSSNVQIIGYGATFKMNQAENTGEQNHVLSIVSSSNITVKGLTLRDGGGDGIYIARYGEGEYSSNVRVEDIIATNNRRQGMSIISVDGLYVRNSTFSGSNGKSPGAGVDFEAESVRDRFVNVVFENCVFRDNYGPGLMTALSKSSSSSIPLDITLRNSYFTNNSRSNVRAYPTEIELGMCTTYRDNPIKGTITFDGLTVENSNWGAIYTKKTAEAYKVVVKNATIRNVSKASSEAAIHIGVLSYANTSTANMGGFTFQNVLIDYDGIDPSLQLFGPSGSKWNLKNMYGEIKVRSPKGIRFSDNMNKLATTSSSTVTLRMVKY